MSFEEGKVTEVITSLEQLEKYKQLMDEAEYLAVDTETTGLGRFDKAVGISLSPNTDVGIYIPLEVWTSGELVNPWSPDAFKSLIEWLSYTLTHKARLVMHNAVFDCKVIKTTLGIELIDKVVCDTALLHHTVINEEGPHGLKDLASKYLTPEANNPQDELKYSVLDNGGKWLVSEKDFYKGDYKVLGTYACWDTIYTINLFYKWIGEVEAQNLQDLWNKEVMPLLKVSYELNVTGLKIDLEYFKKLKLEMEKNISDIEAIIFSEVEDKVRDYEYSIILKSNKITKNSQLGKYLISLGWDLNESNINKYKAQIRAWHLNKTGSSRVFNLDSNNDKAYLLYDVLGFESTTMTKTGKRTVSKADMERLENEHEDNPIIKLMSKRAKEIKLLSTYVIPMLERNINSRMYPSFNQIGTISGRFSSNSINFQTLPRDDLRIKKGIVADDGYVFINSDFSSLEARCFAYMSASKGLKEVYWKNLDLYSKIAIDVFGLSEASAVETDKNYLKKIDPESRQQVKVFCIKSNTLVETSTGFKRIGDIREGEHVRTKFGFKKVTAKYVSKKRTVKFITNRGVINCTDDHKIWSESEASFKEAGKFVSGELVENVINESKYSDDFLYLPINSNASFKNGSVKPISYLKLDEDWAYLLGAFLGDGVGSYTRRKRTKDAGFNSHLISSYVGICGLSDDKVVEAFQIKLKDLGYKMSELKRNTKGNDKLVISTCHDFELVKIFQDTFKAFHQNGIDGRKNLAIQDFIFNSPTSVKVAFLAGLLDTDGYLKKERPNKSPNVALCTKSAEFASDIINLLNTMGMRASMGISYNKTYKRDYYVIRLVSSDVVKLKELGITKYMNVDRKKQAIDLATKSISSTTRSMPKLLKVEVSSELEEEVVDITVEDVHEFVVNSIRVHNCLASVYGGGAYRLAPMLKVDVEEAQSLIDRYLDTYPELRDYMRKSEFMAMKNGFVTNIIGRKKRFKYVNVLYNKYGVRNFNHLELNSLWSRVPHLKDKFESAKHFARAVKGELNEAKNFRIQSLAASIANAAAIKLYEDIRIEGIDAKICLQVHDSIGILAKESDVEKASFLLKNAMENNWVAKLLDVEMKADPVVCKTLEEDK